MATPDPGEQQRQFVRVPARLMTFVRFVETGKVRRAITVDISAGGARLVTDNLIEPGTPLELEIKLPDREALVVCGVEVVRSALTAEASIETAVKITRIDPKDHALLTLYARLNAPPI